MSRRRWLSLSFSQVNINIVDFLFVKNLCSSRLHPGRWPTVLMGLWHDRVRCRHVGIVHLPSAGQTYFLDLRVGEHVLDFTGGGHVVLHPD